MDPNVEALDQLRRRPVTDTVPADRDPLEFPLEALPLLLRRFAKEAADSLPVPIDLVAVPALVCVSAAIGSSRVIQVKDGWIERPALYAAVVAPPGTLKSPALRRATAPVLKKQAEDKREYARAQEAYRQEVERYRASNQTALAATLIPPVEARTWTADVTVERLAGLLAENPRGLLVLRDELAALVNSLNQYKGGKGADRQFYLSAWSGEAVVVDRQGKESVQVEHPFLSIIGCIPPDMLSTLQDEKHREDGFLHRFLLSHPEMVPVRWTDRTISDEARKAYMNLCDRLYSLRALSENPFRAVMLSLSDDAQKFFVTWYDEHCWETESDSLGPGLRGYYAKLKGYCARLALIHAVCTDPEATVVGRDSVAAACDLIEYFKAHAVKALPLSTAMKRSPEKRCEDEIIRMHRGGRILTKREAQRKSNFEAAIFNKAHVALVDVGRLCKAKNDGPEGRPQHAYRLADDE